jgi:O-methyltransferase involved in polyketide biosynthesis
MKRNQASITSQGIALARAVESDKPAGVRICYDPLARRMVSPWFYALGKFLTNYGERRSPGVMDFLVARCRCLEALQATRQRNEVTNMQRYRRFTGEGLTFGIPEGQIEAFLAQRGFTQIKNTTGQDLHRTYFTGVNLSRQVAPIYAIACAVLP